jgi:hypothetical protein
MCPAACGDPVAPQPSLNKDPKNLPHLNPKSIMPGVVPANVNEPDILALATGHDCKGSSLKQPIEFPIVRPAVDFLPVLSARRGLDNP